MSETREEYKVTIRPGWELDKLVSQVMAYPHKSNWETRLLPYSTHDAPAMQAWTWLEEHFPRTLNGRPMLGRNEDDKPCVFEVIDVDYINDEISIGTTYPHAIALAVVEVGKALGVIDLP